MMDPLQIFDNFKLDTLDEKWSNEVWSREFLSFPEPPVDYSILLGSEDMEAFLKETCRALKKWMAENKGLDDSNLEERIEVSWQTLTALNIDMRGLLAVLGYLIKSGQAAGADEDSRQACLSSASLYFTLLSIPGSSTFHVFHPNLYQQAIQTLKLCEHLVVKKKPFKESNLENMYSYDQAEDMLQSEKITLVKGLNSILFELITMLKTFYMKYQLRSLEITVINLVDITKLETETNHFQKDCSKGTEASKTSLSYNAYVALQDLCDPKHGVVEDTIRLIMKYFMPHLCPHYLDLQPKAANVVWDTIIHFFKKLLISKGSSAELGIMTLIQHLLTKCPDRSEPRQKQAAVVSKLINICEGEIFFKSIENLINFCYHNRIQYRIFGQEVIGKLLIEITINIPENEVDSRRKAKMLLIATALSRTMDSSSMVRGKAMSIVESIVNNDKLVATDFLNISEVDKPFPTNKELLKALATDFNPLPGANTFSSLLLDRIKDERALVRRSAMHALQNLVIYFPALLDKVAPIIAHHCRDPALSVRRDAIHALTILLKNNPLNKRVLEEFIRSVLPRIYDVEIKVQEKVVDSFQNLILDKIYLFTEEVNDETQYLPWKIVYQFTRDKMRKNFSKICDSWVKNGVITSSLIYNIQSHIGTKHDMQAWILLSALAENMTLPNMKKYFEDYKCLFEQNSFVSTLKVEVLRHTWKSMSKDYLRNLEGYILECLCKFRINLEIISACIDILGEITKYLHGSKGEQLMTSHVVNLIRLSEAQIQQLTKEKKQIEDEKVVIYLKAMNLLGHASFLCSENVSESTLNIIQGVLLDCNTVKMSTANTEKLKAAGIVVLGQQAMRDRDFAEQVMPILGQLMCKNSTSDSLAQAAIRINAVKALADLCVRFTALVEPYLPDMCISMKDSNTMVREAIVVIFVQLLLEDYIKVKGAFFYHILTMLSDKDETIKDLTVFLIKERLLAKNKTLISQSFIKSIFHYNNCQTKHKFTDRKIRKTERDVLTLPGRQNQAKRRIIYDFMLENLDPPSKLKILTKLNSEVFEGVCEKFINIEKSEGACVLKDVFYIITNNRMQASFGSKLQEEEFPDENTAFEIATSNAINVIVEGMKKFKLTVMVPTLIKLKQFLSECKSSLLVDVSKFLIKIMSDFNNDQVAEIYDEHPDLKKEIDHDISMYGKRPEDTDCDLDEEYEPVNKSMTEENTSDVLKQKDLNFNVSTKDSLKQQKPSATTPRKIQDIQLLHVPRIVLRRLSTLTYPGINVWMSPPRETKVSQSSDPGPSSSGISVSSSSPSEELTTSSPDLFEPEIRSTPKPKKISRLSKKTADVQKL